MTTHANDYVEIKCQCGHVIYLKLGDSQQLLGQFLGEHLDERHAPIATGEARR